MALRSHLTLRGQAGGGLPRSANDGHGNLSHGSGEERGRTLRKNSRIAEAMMCCIYAGRHYECSPSMPPSSVVNPAPDPRTTLRPLLSPAEAAAPAPRSSGAAGAEPLPFT